MWIRDTNNDGTTEDYKPHILVNELFGQVLAFAIKKFALIKKQLIFNVLTILFHKLCLVAKGKNATRRNPFMKKIITYFCVLTALAMPFSAGLSQNQDASESKNSGQKTGMGHNWGLGIKAGLNGVGFEIVKGFGDRINARLGYSRLVIPYSTAQNIEGYNLQIDANVTLGGANLLFDYYPVKNIFHVTGGLILNNTLVGVDVQSLSSFPYGDINIPAEDVGFISGKLCPGNLVSPYVALGFGNTLSRNHQLSFNFELGTFYQGPPRIELSGEGVIGPMASENNTTVINNAIAQYAWFPMLNVQLTYKIL